jgi:hypothetical protein
MATIGTITVAFTADLAGLSEGIENAVDMFNDLSERVDELTGRLEDMAKKTTTIRVDADTSGIARARDEVAALSSSAAAASVRTSVTADASSVSQAAESVATLSEEVEAVTAPATQARSAFVQLYTATAQVASTAIALVSGYDQLRTVLLRSIQESVGARSAAEALVVVQAALRGNTAALSVVFQAGWAAIDRYIQSLFTVEGAAEAMTSGLRAILSALGVTDQAVVRATEFFASFGIQQIATAAQFRFVQRVIDATSEAYTSFGNAVARVLTGTEAGAAAGARAADAIGFLSRAASQVDSVFQALVTRVTDLFSGFNIVGAASATTGDIFDAVARAASALYTRISTASISFSAFGEAASAIASSVAPLVGTIGNLAARTGAAAASFLRFIPLVGTLYEAFGLMREASDTTSTGFLTLLARFASMQVAISSLAVGIASFATGQGFLAGVLSGSASAMSALSFTFPPMAAAASLAAVASGEFSDELLHLSLAAQATGQMADRFGTSANEMARLGMAAKNTNVSMSQLAKGQQSFYTSLDKIKVGQFNVENVREAKLAFDRLGISVEELKSESPQEVFALVAEELSKVEDPAKRTAIAFDLFGRQGAAILPALKEFGELAMDFKRLGGEVSKLNFQRLIELETSFDRVEAASENLTNAFLIPFVTLQRGLNNFTADVKGGLVSAFTPFLNVLADIGQPLAVLLEVLGRVINIMLRLAGAVATVYTAALDYGAIADLFTMVGDGALYLLSGLEEMVTVVENIASVIEGFLRPSLDEFKTTEEALVGFLGALASLVVAMAVFQAVATSAALRTAIAGTVMGNTWVLSMARMVASMAVSSVSAIATAASYTMLGYAAVVAGIQAHIAWLLALGPLGLVAALVELISIGFIALYTVGEPVAKLFTDLGRAVGFIGEEKEQIDATKASVDELAAAAAKNSSLIPDDGNSVNSLAESISTARGELDGLIIESSRFGKEGGDAASVAKTEFDELQKKLGKGTISAADFEKKSKQITDTLRENLDLYRDDSPEATLKKNAELYGRLNDAAKAAGKTVRDISAGTVVGDKLFPTSERIKSAATQYKNEYLNALEEIKKKQQSGGFQVELKQRRASLEEDFKQGRISTEEYQTTKLELDSTSAQQEAEKAAEEAKRTYDRQNDQIGRDTSFADDIRKSLEDAFLSPVQKFEKELKKIQSNKSLTFIEKFEATQKLRQDARESLVGKNAQTSLQERLRDINQGEQSGLITGGEATAQAKKAMDDFAQAIGVTKTPFEQFSSSLDNIASQFGFAGQSLDQVRQGLSGNAEQLALFERAVKQSRDSLLQSLGIEKTPQEVYEEQIKRINEAENAKEKDKRITREQANQARDVARRRRNEALGAGAGVAESLDEKQRKIDQAFGGGRDPARQRIATNNLNIERRRAAGLDATATQQLDANRAEINDAFGVTGMTLKRIQDTLTPERFAEYEEALKKSRDSVLSGLGIEQSPADKAGEAMRKLQAALDNGKISLEEFNKGAGAAKDALLQSLGIPLDPAKQLANRLRDLDEARASGRIDDAELARGQDEARRSMLPGSDNESPVKSFRRDLDAVNRAVSQGLISESDGAERRLSLAADLQESLKPALDRIAPDRRGIEGADVRSKAGVDTYFRILRGRDNPSLKAQLDTARNTRLIAEAMSVPEAAPVITQLSAK